VVPNGRLHGIAAQSPARLALGFVLRSAVTDTAKVIYAASGGESGPGLIRTHGRRPETQVRKGSQAVTRQILHEKDD